LTARASIASARRGLRLLGALALVAFLGCAAPPHADRPAPALPEFSSGSTAKPGWSARRFMVAAANPLAADAGYQMLRAGGSALDAAVAVQMVLALVEPQSSGIGGGAFLMHWDGQSVQAWDGRETAPAAVDDKLFLRPDGQPMAFDDAVFGGRAVGVPGAVRMLEVVHRQHGRLPWARLFEPAVLLAEQGFEISPRLHSSLKGDALLRKDAASRAYFFGADGEPYPVGHRLRNPALAQVLRAIAAQGSAALHEGPVAADVVRRVRAHATNPGLLSSADMADYKPLQREAICTDWKQVYRVCGFPPPSSGHLAVMQMLGIVERAPSVAVPLLDGIPGPDWLHVHTEAARLAYADRASFVADPGFVPAPGGDWRSMLDGAYLQQRAALIGVQSMKVAQPGTPGVQRITWAPQPEQREAGTSHVSIVDADGHAVSMTTTIESAFGARLLSDGGTGQPGGFLLNNQLTDFSFAPADAVGRAVANRVQPGKRPRSSMSPTLVFDRRDGRLLMSLGSPLGAAIPHFVAKTLIGSFDWGLNAQQAIDLPNFASFNGPTVLEAGRFPAGTVAALRARGHTVVEAELTSGLQAIQRTPDGWFGGADPRREGIVMGD
jgi:gamma-glutamyltranspeptidase/glutathione hydrolase